MSAAAPAKYIGSAVDRVDGRLKVTGRADYTADYHFPGQAWAYAVKSTVAKGKVTQLDLPAW
jgi:xanthine dehydrogenase YagR molybdenum-binding subunit